MCSLTQISHHCIAKHAEPIDYAIDATCGNGFDTEFLLNNLSSNGKVFAFDVQKIALQRTHMRVHPLQNSSRLTLIHASHHTVLHYIPSNLYQKINVIMFNLGYLPNSPSQLITTQAETTLQALRLLPMLLAPNGIVSILAYPGHSQGKHETQCIKTWLSTQTEFSIDQYDGIQRDNSPILWLLKN